jgi:ubiquinone/menaquinone biosynthesis C-methylase UbiE
MELDYIINYLAERPAINEIPVDWDSSSYTSEFFNEWAAGPGFSGWAGDRPDEEEADIMAGLLQIQRDAALLDVCCGYGRHAVVFAKKYGQEVTGIDISRGLITAAKKLAEEKGAKIKFEVKHATDIAWKNKYETAVIANNSFSLIAPEQAQNVLAKIFHALKPGGRLFLDLDNKPFNCRYGDHATRWHYWPLGLTLEEVYFREDLSVETNRDITMVKGSDKLRDFVIFKRIYSLSEVKGRLIKTGFTDIKTFGDWDLSALGDGSRKMLIAAMKE